jgi:hypothetical protein
MQKSHGKGPASHPDPESCVDGRKAGGEALTGAHAGQPSSCEIIYSGVPTPLSEAECHTEIDATGKPISDPAQSKTLRMRGNSLHGNREIPTLPVADGATGRPEKANRRTSGMHGAGKSDGRIVPQKPPNKDGPPTSAEVVEGRRPAKGNALPPAPYRTQSPVDGSSGLQRVREAVRRDKRARFTALRRPTPEPEPTQVWRTVANRRAQYSALQVMGGPHGRRHGRAPDCRHQRGRKSRMAAAISAACVSSAKCPVSKKRTSASGISRLNASAPCGRKNGSFLPHTARNGGL